MKFIAFWAIAQSWLFAAKKTTTKPLSFDLFLSTIIHGVTIFPASSLQISRNAEHTHTCQIAALICVLQMLEILPFHSMLHLDLPWIVILCHITAWAKIGVRTSFKNVDPDRNEPKLLSMLLNPCITSAHCIKTFFLSMYSYTVYLLSLSSM